MKGNRLITLPAIAVLAIPAPTAWAQAPVPPRPAAGAHAAAPAQAAVSPPVASSSVTTAVPLAETLHGPAKDAYDTGKLLILNNDFQGALAKFQQAYDLSKDPRLLSNMSVCEKNLRHYARMKTLLERYDRESGAGMTADERAGVAAALAAIGGLVGTLRLTVSPDGATVLLDASPVGTTPLKDAVLVDLGKHTITARADGFEPVDKPIDIAGGSVLELALALQPVAHSANLTVAADEAATVMLDGKVVGNGSYHEKVAAGPHTVRVTEAGKLPFESEVELHDGESRTLEVTLREEKHGALVWPWVVGGVAVAAGAVVGGYFLFQPSNTTTPVPVGKFGAGSLQLNNARLSR